MKVTVKINGEDLVVPGTEMQGDLETLNAVLEAASEAKYPMDQFDWNKADVLVMNVEITVPAKQTQDNPA